MSSSEHESLRAFYVEYRQQLYTYAVSITGNRESAEDAVHAVFQRLLRGGKRPVALRPYVFRGVRNAALDARRRSHARRASLFEEAEAVPGATPGAAPAAELERCLEQLAPDERETIILKIYDEFTFQEIADLRRVPLATAASWYRRGIDKLKARLNAERP